MVAVSTATTATAVAALGGNDIVMLIVLPLVASWLALAGVGVLEEQPLRKIGRTLLASALLGGMAGLVALAAIDLMHLRGPLAALVSLSCGMGALTLAQRLRGNGGRLLDPLLGAIGLRRQTEGEKAQAAQNLLAAATLGAKAALRDDREAARKTERTDDEPKDDL